MKSILDHEFYPTPREVIQEMMLNESPLGKVILEPSAGSGNIVEWLNEYGAKEVLACEKDPRLRSILTGKADIIADDFFTVQAEDVSHIDMIVMNPPFSNADKHILHAWEIAPPGCTIIALCNSSTVNPHTRNTSILQLCEIIEDNGSEEYLGQCFAKSERPTDVSVSLVRLYKPGTGQQEFQGFFLDEDNDELSPGSAGLMPYNFVRDMVNRYVMAVTMFDQAQQAADNINSIVAPVDTFHIQFKAVSDRNRHITRSRYKKELQKACWKLIFNKLDLSRFVTAKVRETINRFVEQQEHAPFTMRNIYRMIHMIIQTHGNRMQQTLVEAFDLICSYSAENSTAGETWKTNANYMVNRKFIIPHMCVYQYLSGCYYNYVRLSSYGDDRPDDIHLALCHLTATPPPANYDERFSSFVRQHNLSWGQWFEWGFFRVKAFKKGTMHFEFLSEDVWLRFNQEVAKVKGWALPKKTAKRK